jgi:hypothetical protein
MPQRAQRSRPETRPAKEKTTINLDVDLKRRAQKLAIDHRVDLQDLIAEGLRYILTSGRIAPVVEAHAQAQRKALREAQRKGGSR